jgi:predicted glycoside hydrolase/deacetylase ChbG (UPF0249 family)
MIERELIVNADDFGRTQATNEGIIRTHECGIVTSASLMVDSPGATAAARYAEEHPELSVGLHVDLGEWEYRDTEWVTVYERGPADHEIVRQLERFRALLGRYPTHLDSHQHVHRAEPVGAVLAELAAQLGIPLRGNGPILYCGDFYGQTGRGEAWPAAIEPAAIVALIARLPPGVTELGCHPGLDSELDSVYRTERLREVETLCDPRVLAAVQREHVRLRSFETHPSP